MNERYEGARWIAAGIKPVLRTMLDDIDRGLERLKSVAGESTCVWSRADDDTDLWEGSCGVAWSLSEGQPSENGMNYCPRCGAKLEQAKDGGA